MYAASVALMAANQWCTNGLEQYFALTGALLLGGALGVTTVRHIYWIEYLQVGPVKYPVSSVRFGLPLHTQP